MKALALIFEFISEAWGLIYKLALVVIAIVIAVSFIKSCTANATLNEQSSCQQFQQADTTTQNKVLQDMMAAHNTVDGLATTRFSVELYCQFHDSNSPIDGIYNSSKADEQSVLVLNFYTTANRGSLGEL